MIITISPADTTGTVLSMWSEYVAEVPEVEVCEGGSAGPSFGLHHCLKIYLVEELQQSSHLVDLVSLDRSWNDLAVPWSGMRIHYSHADPSGNSGCTELLSGVPVLD